ncbi:transcriptional regulator PpsR [Aquibium sp. A9E412]|uniref:transcriptional regulator PpsR n=1 Tax=Aquibium sp. A9E412 TaxID=2976767 RepID=UPI0025B0BCAA|nr:transcriptional regulator PpsR [Aquibium sp. A9E412]MDN2566068.1 transcriptional regulator PpsR [Aquibium sp. A9E412]
MDDRISRSTHRTFSESEELFASVGGNIASYLASIGSDISLVLSLDGVIRDVAYRDAGLERYGIDDWIGKRWQDTVTPESVEKISALIDESAKGMTTRRRQVNHPAKGLPDLPVDYTVIAIEGLPYRVALGDDLRTLAEIQSQLVRAQLELEREYRKIREAETRYRTVFQKSDQPILIVDGAERRIVDANLSAVKLLGRPLQKLIGEAPTSFLERSERESAAEALSESQHSGTAKLIRSRLSEPGAEQLISIDPFRENGRNNLLLRFIDSEPGEGVPGEDLFQTLPEGLVRTDMKGVVRDTNDQFLDLVSVLNKDRIVGRNLNNWLGASPVDMNVLLSRLREEGQVRQFSTVVRDELGGSRSVVVSAGVYHGNGEPMIGLLIAEAPRRESAVPAMQPGGLASGSSDFSQLVGRVPLKELIREAVDVIEKMCIEAALRQTDNNRASAADMLGLSRQSLYIKLRRHGLENFGSGS